MYIYRDMYDIICLHKTQTHIGMYVYDIVCMRMLPNQLYALSVGLLPCMLQATTYKCDFEKERSDREKAVGRLGTERQEYKLHIAELNGKVKVMHLDHDDS